MKRLLVGAIALLATVLFSGVASASSITIDISYDRTTTSANVNKGQIDLTNPANAVATDRHRFNVLMTLSGLAPDEDFFATSFDINLGLGLTKQGNWAGVAGVYNDASGDPQNFFAQNVDQGNDFKAILVQAGNATAASRQYGEAGRNGNVTGDPDTLGDPKTRIGQFTVTGWSGQITTVSITPIAGNPWGIFRGNATGEGAADGNLGSAGFTGSSFQLGGAVVDTPVVGPIPPPDPPDAEAILDFGNGRVLTGPFPGSGQLLILNHPGEQDGMLRLWANVTGVADMNALAVALTTGDIQAVALDGTGNPDPPGNPFNLPGANLYIKFGPGTAPLSGAGNVGVDYNFGAGSGVGGFAVPEPSTLALAGMGLVGLVAAGLRRRRSA